VKLVSTNSSRKQTTAFAEFKRRHERGKFKQQVHS